jgi:hypothetical protein
MAAGTIALTKISPAARAKTRSVHVFLEAGGPRDSLNPNQCLSCTQFILMPNQECLVITNMMASSVTLDLLDLQAPLQFVPQNSLRLCYRLVLKQPGMAMIVGEKTPLTLLINSGCVTVNSFCATPDQWFKLFDHQNLYPKKRTAEPSGSTEAKKVCL